MCLNGVMRVNETTHVMSIIDLEGYLSGTEQQVGGFDILYKDGMRYGPPEGSESYSYLGCANNRMTSHPNFRLKCIVYLQRSKPRFRHRALSLSVRLQSACSK